MAFMEKKLNGVEMKKKKLYINLRVICCPLKKLNNISKKILLLS